MCPTGTTEEHRDNGTLGGNASQINNWYRLFGGDGFQAVFHPTNPDIYYFEYQNGAINGTTDGKFFGDATQGIEGSEPAPLGYAVHHEPP
jgi:hypothetical protein